MTGCDQFIQDNNNQFINEKWMKSLDRFSYPNGIVTNYKYGENDS